MKDNQFVDNKMDFIILCTFGMHILNKLCKKHPETIRREMLLLRI